MRKILVPFDGSDSSVRALEHVLGLAHDGLPLYVELLNVQDPMPTGSLALPPARIRHIQADEAGKVLGPARKKLEQAGVPTKHPPGLSPRRARLPATARKTIVKRS